MKKILSLVIGLSLASVCFAQTDPVIGFWLSVDEKTNKVSAGWQIYVENDILYGKILSVPDQPRDALATECKDSYKNFPVAGKVNKMPLAGTPFIFGLTQHSPGEWRNGNVIDPNDGNIYGCRVIFREAGSRIPGKMFQTDTLEMRGNLGPFNRSQFWRKTDQATASGQWPN